MGPMAFRHAALAALLASASTTAATTSSGSPITTDGPTPSPQMPGPVTTNSTGTPSPNEPIPKPECNSSIPVSVRYSATTGRLYLEALNNGTRGGCVTLDQIWEARGGGAKGGAKAPLFAIDPVTGAVSENITNYWLLEEDLYVEDGITLKVFSTRRRL